MSIEQTPPNLENDGIESDVERVSADFDRIHALCEILSPAFPQIEEGVPIEDEALREKFTELTVLLNELHPADVAAVLAASEAVKDLTEREGEKRAKVRW